MKKYLLKSNLHEGKEFVVLIENLEATKRNIEYLRKSMNFTHMLLPKEDGTEHRFLCDDILLAEEILFTQKEAIEKLKEEKDKYELGLIDQEEFERRKSEWSKFIR